MLLLLIAVITLCACISMDILPSPPSTDPLVRGVLPPLDGGSDPALLDAAAAAEADAEAAAEEWARALASVRT